MRIWFLCALLIVTYAYASVPSLDAGESESDTDLYLKSQSLEKEVRDLRGKLEKAEFKMQKLQEKLDNFIADVNYKNSIQKSPQPTPQAGAQSGAQKNKMQVVQNIQGQEPSKSIAQHEFPKTYINHITTGNVDKGIAGILGYLKHAPEATLSEAYYWLGKGFFKKQSFDKSGFYFTKSYKQDSKARHAPSSLLLLASSFKSLGKDERACGVLTILSKEQPSAPIDVTNKAHELHNNLGCN